jgi:hypothetical protein
MMKKNVLYLITFLILFSQNSVFGQVLNLGSIENFVIFSSNGAEANTGISSFIGDIGADLGAVSLAGATIFGNVYIADLVTAQAKVDLQDTYIQLLSIPTTNSMHLPAFGGGEILTTGNYLITSAGSLGGNLTLNGQGDSNAVFIFKFGGAFAVGANSEVVLINGTRSCNVFWVSEGAISMAASTIMKGTLIANNGAVNMASGCDLEGRLLSISGAISFGPAMAHIPTCITTILLISSSPCYNIILGSAANFVHFTSSGAIGNTGVSYFTGDIGSDIGAISGFESSAIIGTFYNVDAVTQQAKIDLQAAYFQLSSIPVTNATHAPAFGSDEVLTAGVYLIGGAGSIAGNLILDGQGDSSAMFIFKFGGAFTTGANTSIVLTNCSSACNIYWLAEGAISMASSTTMKGTLIANNAANSMAAGGNLEGRMFSTTGAIAIDQIVATNMISCYCPPPVALPVDLLSFTAKCDNNFINLKWSTASENNSDYFSVERSTNEIDWINVGNVSGAGNSSSLIEYYFSDFGLYSEISYYQLKQTDFNGEFKIFNPISIKKCIYNESDLTVFPNPGKNTFAIDFKGNSDKILSISIYDIFDNKIYSSDVFNSFITLNNCKDGIYFLHLVLKTESVTRKFIVLN